jgi:hypothetical protein
MNTLRLGRCRGSTGAISVAFPPNFAFVRAAT